MKEKEKAGSGFCVYHFEKYYKKSNLKALDGHMFRIEGFEKTFKHADPERYDLNRDLTPEKFKNIDLRDAINLRIQEGYTHKNKDGSLRKIKSDAVMMHSHVLSASHDEMFELVASKDKFEEWLKCNYSWLAQHFGEENIVRFVVHMDEKTPHIHAVTVPITKEGKLNAASFTGKAEQLADLQNSYGEHMQQFGFKRGIKDTGRKHISTRDFYYKMINDIENGLETKKEEIKLLVQKLGITSNDLQEARMQLEKDKETLKEQLVSLAQDELIAQAKQIINDSYEKYCAIYKAGVYLNRDQNKILSNIIKQKVTLLGYFLSLEQKGIITVSKQIGDMLYIQKKGEGKANYVMSIGNNTFSHLDDLKIKQNIFQAANVFEGMAFADAVKYFADYSDIIEAQKEALKIDISGKKIVNQTGKIEDKYVLAYIRALGLTAEDLKDYGCQITYISNAETGKRRVSLAFECGDGYRAYYRYWEKNQDVSTNIGDVKSIVYDIGNKDTDTVKFFSDPLEFIAFKKLNPTESYRAVIINDRSIEEIYHLIDTEIDKKQFTRFELHLRGDEMGKAITKCIGEGYSSAIQVIDKSKFLDSMEVESYKKLLALKCQAERELIEQARQAERKARQSELQELQAELQELHQGSSVYWKTIKNSILLNRLQQNNIGVEEWLAIKAIAKLASKIKL